MKDKQVISATISANIEVFDYLCEKSGDRKSKTEAYIDLLYKASDGFVSPFLRKKKSEPGPCQCHVNISDLASDWGWHRATVRSFLEKLEQLGQLKRERQAKSVIITITSMSGQSSSPDVVHDTPDLAMQLMEVLSDWIIGSSDTDTVGTSCGRLVREELERIAGSAGQSYPDNDTGNSSSDIGKLEDSVKEKALGCIALAALQKVLRKSRFGDITPVIQFFRHELCGEWDAFLDASKELAEIVFADDSSVPGFRIPNDRNCLKSLKKPFLSLVAKSHEAF